MLIRSGTWLRLVLGVVLLMALPYLAVSQERSSDRATIVLRVPADATVLIADDPTTQTGTERIFITPVLNKAKKRFSYAVKATWIENGKARTVERVVQFTAGERVVVDLTRDPVPPTVTPKPPEVKKDTPKPPVIKKDVPKPPEVKKDTPKPEVKKDTPKPEVKKDTPKPEVKKDTPKPEVKKDTPKPPVEVKKDKPKPPVEVKKDKPKPPVEVKKDKPKPPVEVKKDKPKPPVEIKKKPKDDEDKDKKKERKERKKDRKKDKDKDKDKDANREKPDDRAGRVEKIKLPTPVDD